MTRPRTFVASAIVVGAVESVVVGMAVGILVVAAGTVDSLEDVLVLLAD